MWSACVFYLHGAHVVIVTCGGGFGGAWCAKAWTHCTNARSQATPNMLAYTMHNDIIHASNSRGKESETMSNSLLWRKRGSVYVFVLLHHPATYYGVLQNIRIWAIITLITTGKNIFLGGF